MHAEFVACYEATGQVNWLKKFMPGLKVVDDINKPLKLYCDNNPAVCYARNNKSSGAAKHIDIKYYVVKDKVWDQSNKNGSICFSCRNLAICSSMYAP